MTTKSSSEEIKAKLAAHQAALQEKEGDTQAESVSLLDHPEYEALMVKLTEAEQKAGEHWDRILRMQAEADNAARRSERELANAHKFALDKFVADLLPVIDNLERSITAAQEGQTDATVILEGVELTLKMFKSALEKAGVRQIDPLNEPFNPLFHEAVSTQDQGSKPGMVLAVLQKGYLLNDRLVRSAMVVVSK